MPNKYNIFIYCLAAFVLSSTLFFIGELTGGLSPVLHNLLYSTSILTLLFGLITYFTRPRPLNIAQRKARQPAMRILAKIDGHAPLDSNHSGARVIEIVEKTTSLGLGEEDIDKLYDLVPACLLPPYYRDERCIIDWHRFDLCIISANQDIELARLIEKELRVHRRDLRVFVDDEPTIEYQQKEIERNYYAGSRLCLALISVHLIHDTRRRVQLNYARQREEKVSKNRRIILSGNAAYLKPVPLDPQGFLYMQKTRDLAPFVEFSPLILDRNHLLRVVVKSILKELRKVPYWPPTPTDIDNSKIKVRVKDTTHRVFISHSHKDNVFACHLYDDLQARGVDCWIAPKDLEIGASTRDAIEDALRLNCKLLVILTENAIKSPWVQNEVELAFEKERDSGKTILFPIKIDNSIKNATAAWVRTLRRQRHIGDFTGWENPDAYKRALDRLVTALQSKHELVEDFLSE
jgi:TIR domain-containing protein